MRTWFANTPRQLRGGATMFQQAKETNGEGEMSPKEEDGVKVTWLVTWQIVHDSQLEESKEVKDLKEPKEETKEPQASPEKIPASLGLFEKKQIICDL